MSKERLKDASSQKVYLWLKKSIVQALKALVFFFGLLVSTTAKRNNHSSSQPLLSEIKTLATETENSKRFSLKLTLQQIK